MNEDRALEVAQRIARGTGAALPRKVIVRDPSRWRAASDYYLGVRFAAPGFSNVRLEVGAALLLEAPDDVLEALIAHEIGHLRSPWRMPRVRVTAAAQMMTSWIVVLALAAQVVVAVVLGLGWMIGVVGLITLTVLVLYAVSATLGWAEEYAADEFGAAVVGAQAMVQATEWAMAHYRPPAKLMLLSAIRTHPPMGARLRRLERQLAADGAAEG